MPKFLVKYTQDYVEYHRREIEIEVEADNWDKADKIAYPLVASDPDRYTEYDRNDGTSDDDPEWQDTIELDDDGEDY